MPNHKSPLESLLTDFFIHGIKVNQEIIKVRERILAPKVIPLKLYLDIGPSSSADIIRALRGCPREVSDGLCRFDSFQSKENLQRCGDFLFDILITRKGASALNMFEYISKLK